ncbi:MAG: helix-turn-helix domain-containing protein [Clostridia bacterium]|nr:helix-turn-helix domain-containing protein [Clostridia bacterium]
MLKVLVVDDEPIMRNAYSTLIDWKENGFSLVGSVHNGKVALDFMRTSPVDIVITDLKMPVMSGLEFIRLASKEFPRTKFIVMSGFDEFHLVKEAYELGIKEYFLKIELDPASVLQTLFKLRDEIENEHTAESVKSGGYDDYINKTNEKTVSTEQVHSVHWEKVLKNLIWGAYTGSTEKQLLEHEIRLQENNLGILVLSLPCYYVVEEKMWEGERETFKYAILNVLEEICRKYNNLYVFCNLPSEFVIVCDMPEKSDTELRAFFKEARNALLECFELDADCGLSSCLGGYVELKNTYREARLAAQYCFMAGHGKFIAYKDLPRIDVHFDVAKGVKELKKLFVQPEPEKIRNGVFGLRVSPDSVGAAQVDKIKSLFYSYYIEMINFIEESGLQGEATENVSAYEAIKDGADLNAMNEWFIKSMFEIADALACSNGMYKVINYIKVHYGEQLSLGKLAELLEVSEGHLSRTFQKKVGMSFTRYLLKVRMDMAVNLLQNENLKIYEVAMRVGYPNAEQFSRMFKKVMGESPKKFQK